MILRRGKIPLHTYGLGNIDTGTLQHVWVFLRHKYMYLIYYYYDLKTIWDANIRVVRSHMRRLRRPLFMEIDLFHRPGRYGINYFLR